MRLSPSAKKALPESSATIARGLFKCTLVAGSLILAVTRHAVAGVDWPAYGGTAEGRRWSDAADITPAAFRLTKRQIREPFLRDAAEIAGVSADEIDSHWASPETHQRIREYLAKTIGKK